MIFFASIFEKKTHPLDASEVDKIAIFIDTVLA